MKTYIVVLGAAVAVLAWSGSLAAHHSLARFDTTTPVWVTGTVIRIERINPHSLIVIDQPRSNQPAQRWVIDGPSPNVLARMRLADDFVMPGEVLTVCGFVLKDDPATDSARQISGHLLVLPSGKRQFWSTTASSRSVSNRARRPTPTVAKPSGVSPLSLFSPCAPGQRTDRTP